VESLHSNTLSDRLTEILGSRITAGDLTGSSSMDELGQQYGVSRSVVRDCVIRLSQKGLVLARAGVGSQINDREKWDLLDADVLRWLGPHDPAIATEMQAISETIAQLDGPLARALVQRLSAATA
jgi:DNA-binding FadR family transcriptional regulator